MSGHPPRSTPFPSATLFRPQQAAARVPRARHAGRRRDRRPPPPVRQSLGLGGRGHRAPPLVAVARLAGGPRLAAARRRSEEHTSELQSRQYLVCRLLLEKKK